MKHSRHLFFFLFCVINNSGVIYLLLSVKSVDNLPGVGEDPDGVAEDEDDHDVDVYPGQLHLALTNNLLW